MADQVQKKQLLLDDAEIELTIIGNDRLAIAQLISGKTTQEELIRRLSANGVRAGFIQKGIELIVDGDKTQIPVAAAKLRNVPGLSTMPLFSAKYPESTSEWNDWSGAKFDQIIEEGTLLVQVDEPPIVSVIRVNGNKAELERGKSLNARDFAGTGTVVNEENTAVMAEMSGIAFRGIFGQVSITESEEIPALAKSHGKMHPYGSLIIKGEVSKGAIAVADGSVIAKDHVDGASITSAGNVYAQGDIKTQDKQYPCKIWAGQSVRAKSIIDATVWAGADVHVIDKAQDAIVHCLGDAIINKIDGGEIRVGNKLIANEIIEGSRIFLGPRHIETKDLTAEKVILTQHIGRLTDIEQIIGGYRRDYEKSQGNMMGELERVRTQKVSGALRQKAMTVVARHMQMMNEALVKFEEELKLYTEANKVVEHDQARVNYYQHRLDIIENPELLVTGSIQKGVQIYGPGGMLEVEGGLENVRIAPDSFTGVPQVYSL